MRAARCDGRLVGVLVATRPGAFPLPPAPLAARLRCVLGQGIGVAGRWGRVFEALSALHPPEPHAYLATLGVLPEWRGRGIGTALLAAWLDEAPQRRHPGYLETDVPGLLGFYGRAGFEVEGSLELFGAEVWRMRRPGPPPQG